MVAGATISTDLSDKDWLKALKVIGEASGYFTELTDAHATVFIEQSHDVLFVTFETLFGIRSVSDSGMPLAFDICDARNWSHLSLIAEKQDWFRHEAIWAYFDRLVDYGFFDDFDQVIFFGAGMCGYAAAAYSVTAPGATVISLAPQATLDRQLAEWDDRFPSTRQLDFHSRYGFAPDMIEAAQNAFVVYDPDETEDAMHASLFTGSNVHKIRYRRGRAGAIEADMRSMSLIAKLADYAAAGKLTGSAFANLMKARKRHAPYLRALLARVLAEDRPVLTRQLCRAVLAEQPIPRFKHHLEVAERRLAEDSNPVRRPAAKVSLDQI
ncbi:phosphoadenosine phosphosulfate reductase [Rhodobacteraceae bacterium]|nr:phosphoadenosine phosphosulfate reductase [Paracoccaceae bacterium]